MPKTAKGRKIYAAMQKQYGSEEGTSVFYASRNKGTITGVDASIPMTTSPSYGTPGQASAPQPKTDPMFNEQPVLHAPPKGPDDPSTPYRRTSLGDNNMHTMDALASTWDRLVHRSGDAKVGAYPGANDPRGGSFPPPQKQPTQPPRGSRTGKDSVASHRSAWQTAKQRVADAQVLVPTPMKKQPSTSFSYKGVAPPKGQKSNFEMKDEIVGGGHMGSPSSHGSAATRVGTSMGRMSSDDLPDSVPLGKGKENCPIGHVISGDRKVFFKGSVRDALRHGARACDALAHGLRATRDSMSLTPRASLGTRMKLPPHPKARKARIRIR